MFHQRSMWMKLRASIRRHISTKKDRGTPYEGQGTPSAGWFSTIEQEIEQYLPAHYWFM